MLTRIRVDMDTVLNIAPLELLCRLDQYRWLVDLDNNRGILLWSVK